QHSRTLPEPVESNQAIIDIARTLLRELRADRRVPVRLLGVGLSGLTGSSQSAQLPLFDDPGGHHETERDRNLSRVVDRLSDRFGYGTVVSGGMVGTRPDTRDRENQDHVPTSKKDEHS
ncbi:MAG: hypothetical protein ACPHO4_13870, partial [Longimicrobiales bacterium]